MALRLLAVSDVHSPKFLLDFVAALKRRTGECRETSLYIFAGDMVYKGRVEALKSVLDALYSVCGEKPTIAVFGNEEFIGLEERFRKMYPSVKWLDDESIVVDVDGVRVGVVGTRGSLERPTMWQRRKMPWLWRVYAERIRRVEELLSRVKREADVTILVSHYTLTWRTLEGEPREIWPEMGHRGFEEVIRRVKPSLAIHGHAHKSRVLQVVVDSVPVYNVAFPARRDITIIEVEARVE
ncbi:metallophosphoesterase [Pyrolobus fumarii 1A]|uniref:Metallophosphoesterase n=1 Tax=Pyrolobus fumarii (strain DSM 11204 / 1A) TaxID=694429 RepID=G0EFT1_PYRF1|nr:metallophosphoesterase [Pyrolobus fumarii]AEM38252.1 metallophosphoesterase [Pyrolobus fumarii 1A]